MKILTVRAVSLVCAILTALMIFSFSADTGQESGEMSGEITEAILSVIGVTEENTPPADYEGIKENAHFLIRKLAHFSEYCLLGASLCVFFHTFSIQPRISCAVSFAISAAYALLDEWHQAFVPDRGPGMRDVLIDGAGALFGVLIASLAAYWLKRKHQGNHS